MVDFNDFLKHNDLESTPANVFLARALADHLPLMLFSDGVAVPNDEEEMNWRLFFAHSQDMQGFRADIFTGGWNEAKNPYAPQFAGLRDRWPDSRSMIEGLAALWNDGATQVELKAISNPFRPQAEKVKGTRPALDLLRGPRGNEATRMFADTLSEMTGPMVARSTNRMVRAYAQNSALLMKHGGGSYLGYLRSVVPDLYLPSEQIIEAERAWQQAIVRDFYNVGPVLGAYLICDWLLWLWRQGQIEWFESYKEDSVFLKALAEENCLPAKAAGDFPAFCRSLHLPQEWVPRPLFHLAHYGLPPRLVNEAIWLERNGVAEAAKTAPEPERKTIAVDMEQVAYPLRFWQKPEQEAARAIHQALNEQDARNDMAETDSAAEAEAPDETDASYVYVPLLELQEKEDGSATFSPRLLVRDNKHYLPVFTSRENLEHALPAGQRQRMKTPLDSVCSLFVTLANEGPDEVRLETVILDPDLPGQMLLSRETIEKLAGQSLAQRQPTDEGSSEPAQPLPAWLEHSLCPPGETENPDDPFVVVPVVSLDESAHEDGQPLVMPLPLNVEGKQVFAAFTSMASLRRAFGDERVPLRHHPLSTLCALFMDLWKGRDLAGILLDPFDPAPRLLTPPEIDALTGSRSVRAETIKAENILDIAPPSQALSRQTLEAVAMALQQTGISEARAAWITQTSLHKTLLIGVPTHDEKVFSTAWSTIIQTLERLAGGDQNMVPDVALIDLRSSALLASAGEPLPIATSRQTSPLWESGAINTRPSRRRNRD